MRAFTLTLALLLAAAPAFAERKKKDKKEDKPAATAPAIPDIPELPTGPAQPDIPELPELPQKPKPEYKVIEAHAASDAVAPAPTPTPPPIVKAPPSGPGAGTSLAFGAAAALPTADLDVSPAYFAEIAWAPEAGGGSWAVGVRGGYALFKAEREILVAGRGLDKNAFQSSQLVPVSIFFRALGTFESLAGAGLYPYIEAVGGVGLAKHEVHAFGSTDGAVSASPEVGATLGLDWRPGGTLEAMVFARMRSTSASMDGRASAAFMRSSLASTDLGISLGFRL